jgi:ligand-binding sensor domain-containing protein
LRTPDSFVRYIHDPENKYSLSDNDDIDALVIDRNNSNYIWIGTDGGGLNIFDTELKRFYSFRHDPENPNSLSGDKVRSLFQDGHGALWIGTSSSGLNRINLNNIPRTSEGKYDSNKFESIVFEHYLIEGDNKEDSHSASVASIYEDNLKTLWVLLGDSRVLNFDRNENKLIPSPFFIDNKTHFHEMMEDGKGILWFGAHNRLIQLDRDINQIKEYQLNNEGIRSSGNQGLCQDNAGNIWAATWDGIVRVYQDAPFFEHHYHNVDDPSSPAGNYIYSILADRSGKVWLGSHKGLLVMIKDINGSTKFINYSKLHNLSEGAIW